MLGRWSVRGVVAAGLGVATTLVPTPATAQQAEGLRIEAEAGYGGGYIPGRRLPVHVTVRTDRLVRGALEVRLPQQSGSWGFDVEVPGGGVHDFVVVVPTGSTFEVHDVEVRLVAAGGTATAEAEVDALTDGQLVGLLPAVTPADVPAPLPLLLDAGSARFVAVGRDDLQVEGALDPLGTLVGGPDELGRLTAAARASVLDWVDRGGRLVVDAAPGAPIAGLPDVWQPDGDGRRAAGLGEVRVSGGAAAAGRWAELVEPTPSTSYVDLAATGGINVAQFEAVGSAVARDAGLDALELPWLLVFLGAYVVLVGPVSWLVLRRRRAALGWIGVPAIAALFTAGSFVVGSDLRSGTTAAHGTVLETGPGGSRATSVLGLVSRNGSDGRGTFPATWTAGSVDLGWFGGPTPQSGLAVRSSAGAVGATVPLAAGGFGVVRGAGPVEVDGGLVVRARSEGGAVVGTVRNDLPFAVEAAGAMLGRDTDQLGRIEPGATAGFRFDGAELRQRDPYAPPEAALWPAEAGYGSQPRVDSVVNLPLWNDVHMALGPNARTRGIVTVVGWTRAYEGPATAGGDAGLAGRSAVVGRAPVASGDGSVAPGSTHRELVRGPEGMDLPDDGVAARVGGALWRFALPEGAAIGPLALDIPGYIGRADVWDGSGWATVYDDLASGNQFNGDISRVRRAAVPREAAAGGVVWVRGWLLLDFGGFDGAGLDLYAGDPT